MILNRDNYFSVEADKEFMSVSQFKNFEKCEAKALNDIEKESQEDKQCFLEGQLFEALVSGDAKLFIAQHPELISSRGATAGQIKSNYAKVVSAAEKFNSQDFATSFDYAELCSIVGNCGMPDYQRCIGVFFSNGNNLFNLPVIPGVE